MEEISRLSRENLGKLMGGLTPKERSDVIQIASDCDAYMNNSPSYISFNHEDFGIIISSEKRCFRVYDNGDNSTNSSCVICSGFDEKGHPLTTPIIHYTNGRSPENFSFTNFNLFPGATPKIIPVIGEVPRFMVSKGYGAYNFWGLHTLTWATNEHKDIHQLSAGEHDAALEELLAVSEIIVEKGHGRIFPHMIKNTGAISGCSLEHGHYQTLFHNFPSGKQLRDLDFFENNKESYTGFLRRTNRASLDVMNHLNSLRMITPESATRAYEVMIVPREEGYSTFRDVARDTNFRKDLSNALVDYARGLYEYCMEKDKPFGYNVMFIEGLKPDIDMRVHIIPATQITAGMEYHETSLRQKSLEASTDELRKYILQGQKKDPSEYEIIPPKRD